jgi:multiple sugar transport system permease protein
MFQVFASSEFKGRFADVPKTVAGKATKFEELDVPTSGPLLAKFRSAWLPARYARDSVDSRWARLSGGEPMPIAADDAEYARSQAGSLRKEFAGRNYGYVLDYVLLNGRAIWNTALFCILAIVTQLTVNPLAAYALSRYPIRASGQILIFLLATMAFPAEVAMIPSFLLLKQFGLLNTFSALVLPSAASGFMIFLLKGFFDSLPQELFEAGQIDGAKESTMMRKIAFPLSRPVFGYLALLAFMGAYGTFIYAFLIVQDQKMWTLMVWLYQLQLIAPKTVTMAALTVAALPTLIVFLCAQNVIMRGIVLPGEK